MNMDEDRELAISLIVGVICSIFLLSMIGGYGFVNFFSMQLIATIANAFFMMPIINIIVKGVKNVNMGHNLTFIMIGIVFEIVYLVTTQKTTDQIIVDTLKSVITILVISMIVTQLKRTIKEI